jgi:hypothetical protein
MLPVVDVEYVVEELVRAGIDRVLFVSAGASARSRTTSIATLSSTAGRSPIVGVWGPRPDAARAALRSVGAQSLRVQVAQPPVPVR